MTKTTGCFLTQRVRVLLKADDENSQCPSLPSRESERRQPGKILREGCVKAKDLTESVSGVFLTQFEWYRGLKY